MLAARRQGRDIVYTLASGHGLHAGDAVRVDIDWERRWRLMRLHFAAELILELTYRRLPGIEKIGAHIAADKARIDFAGETRLAPLLAELQAGAAALIAADHPISSRYTDEAAEKRCWQIVGFAQVTCGGTHLGRTGEVGDIALRRKNVGKGKERHRDHAAGAHWQ